MTWRAAVTGASMKPDDHGDWDIFITYGGGFDFSNPITTIALATNGKNA